MTGTKHLINLKKYYHEKVQTKQRMGNSVILAMRISLDSTCQGHFFIDRIILYFQANSLKIIIIFSKNEKKSLKSLTFNNILLYLPAIFGF